MCASLMGVPLYWPLFVSRPNESLLARETRLGSQFSTSYLDVRKNTLQLFFLYSNANFRQKTYLKQCGVVNNYNHCKSLTTNFQGLDALEFKKLGPAFLQFN